MMLLTFISISAQPMPVISCQPDIGGGNFAFAFIIITVVLITIMIDKEM